MNRILKLLTGVAVAVFLCLAAGAVQAQAYILVLDPGHGGPGSAGLGCTYPPYSEKGLTLDVATKLKAELSDIPGLTVYMTRTGDTFLSLEERAMYAKSVNADLMISLHFNSSGPHDKTGTEVWTSAFGNNFTVGAALGQQLLQQYTAMGLESKGVKTRLGDRGDYYGIIRNGVAVGIPTIIFEHCFLDYPTDRSILESKGTQGFAHADAVGIYNFLNSNYGLTRGQAAAAPAAGTSGKASNKETAKAEAKSEAQAAAAPAAQQSTAMASQTKYGFPVDAAGNVYYTDASGSKATFSSADWSWLLSQWSYTSDAEGNLKTLSTKDLQTLLDKHRAGQM